MFNPDDFDFDKFRNFLKAKGYNEVGISESIERLKNNRWDETDRYQVEDFMKDIQVS